MFKYSVYNKSLNLTELASYAERLKTSYLETGNILSRDGEFVPWNRVEDVRNFLIDNQKIIICMDTEVPFHDIDYHKELFKRAVLIGIKYIRPEMDESVAKQSERQNQLIELCKAARAYNIGVLVENSANEPQVTDFFENLFKDDLTVKPQFIFNPLEYVREKAHPFFHKFYNSRLKNDIKILRINDGLFKSGKPVLPGEGNAEVKEMASILLSRNFGGWFSVGPYAENIDPEDVIDGFKVSLKNM